jgi:3-deoxy-7-phosphoheptulonate synthase/chorismate mutase
LKQDDLARIRKEVDRINLKLLELLNKRAELVLQISEIKKQQGVKRYDPEREKQMLDLIVANNKGPFDDETVRHLFKQIFSACLNLQTDDQKKGLLVSRKRHPKDTIIRLGEIEIGSGVPAVIAGPCSVETYDQVMQVAKVLSEQGIRLLRGGAFKPRTSPYDFQGLGEEGLKILRDVADQFGLLVVSEVMSSRDLDMALKYIDVIQIGARNMQNFDLLKEAGMTRTPVLLKRGMAATIEELLLAAEYIVSRGNDSVILCERGIRTFEKWTRNTLDISAVPILKNESHLPVVVDLSHATGRRDLLLPLAKASLAAGADGIMIEVHPNPAVALSDAQQQIDLPTFVEILSELRKQSFLPVKTETLL